MTLNYLFEPTFQFLDKSGKPLSDGYVEVYLAGGRTKYITYSDFDETQNEFQVKLDALGSAIILVTPTHRYDVYVYNEYGTLQMSRYNISVSSGGEVVTDVVEIESTDGTINVTASTSTHFDLSAQPVLDDLNNEITARKNADTQLQNNIDNETEARIASDKVLEALAIAAKTEVKAGDNIVVNKATSSDGHDIYTVNGVESVPNVEIESTTLDVSSVIDTETNTKTFTIDIPDGDETEWGHFTLLPSGLWSKISGTMETTSDYNIKVNTDGIYHATFLGNVYNNVVSENYADIQMTIGNQGCMISAQVDCSILGLYAFERSFDIRPLNETLNFSLTLPDNFSLRQSHLYIHRIDQTGTGTSANDKVSVVSGSDAGYLDDVLDVTAPLQKIVEGSVLRLYQDPVEASPLQNITTPSLDVLVDSVPLGTNGYGNQYTGALWHLFEINNYYVPEMTDKFRFCVVQSQTSVSCCYLGIWEYDEVTRLIHLVCLSENAASLVSATGLKTIGMQYIDEEYNIILPNKFYYAGFLCDQSALLGVGRIANSFNLNPSQGAIMPFGMYTEQLCSTTDGVINVDDIKTLTINSFGMNANKQWMMLQKGV